MYNWKKDIVSWKIKDTLYLSIVFSWMLKSAKTLALAHKGKVIAGGPAAMTHKEEIDWADVQPTSSFVSPLLFHNPLATFTSRGCVRKCEFCVVHKVEGTFKEEETWRPAPIICDNNLTAASKKHFERVIDSVKHFPFVDINQGMDARLFSSWHAQQLQKLKAVKIRFAFDDIKLESKVADAFQLARKHGFRDFGCYVLIGFNDTPEEAQYKLECVRKWKLYPNPMRFQPWNTFSKNAFILKGWTHESLQDTVRYYSNLARWRSHSFEEYQEFTHGQKQTGGFGF